MLFYDDDCLFGSGYTEILTVGELMYELDEIDKRKLEKLIKKYDEIQSNKEENKVTDKQESVIRMICDNLEIDYPLNLTKQSARKFISDNIDESKRVHNEMKRNMEESFEYDENHYELFDERF